MDTAAATSERVWQELLSRLEPWVRRVVVESALELELHDLVDEAVRLRVRRGAADGRAGRGDGRDRTGRYR
jgi:hypothetical protein